MRGQTDMGEQLNIAQILLLSPGHRFKLYKKSSCKAVIFSERVVNVWNCLAAQVDFSLLSSFTCTVKHLSEFLSF